MSCSHPGRWRVVIKVQSAKPDPEDVASLPGADFADAYSTQVPGHDLDTDTAAERLFARSPAWVTLLLILRNIIVMPFGLKTGADQDLSRDAVGIFPVIERRADYLLLGFDDKHQDFRVIVRIANEADAQTVTLTTVCRTHNLLGRTYLATILPFHRLIIRTMLSQVAP